jgi:hypothetical protein
MYPPVEVPQKGFADLLSKSRRPAPEKQEQRKSPEKIVGGTGR